VVCRTAVTRNYSEKCINSILDHVSSSSNMELLQVSDVHKNCVHCVHTCIQSTPQR
jgi:hypothetical protein